MDATDQIEIRASWLIAESRLSTAPGRSAIWVWRFVAAVWHNGRWLMSRLQSKATGSPDNDLWYAVLAAKVLWVARELSGTRKGPENRKKSDSDTYLEQVEEPRLWCPCRTKEANRSGSLAQTSSVVPAAAS